MTFRAKPVVKRDHRPAWETQDRRNFYLNLGFGLIVLLAVLILAIAAGVSYYNDHLAPVGSVDGESITKDEFTDRYQVEAWRLDEAEARVADLDHRRAPDRSPGHLAPVEHRPAARGAPDDHARAAHRHQAPGEARSPGRRDRHARGHRRPARLRGDHPRIAPPVGDRGQARDRSRRDRPVRGPEERGKGQGRGSAQGHRRAARPGRTSPRPSRPMRRPDRRPAISAGSRPTTREPTRRCSRPPSPRSSTRRPPSSRAATASSASVASTEIVASSRRYRLPGQDSRTRGSALAKYRTVLQGDVIHEKLQAKIVGDVTGAGAAAARVARSTSAKRPRISVRTRSRSATSCTHRRATRRTRRPFRRTIPRGRLPSPRRPRPTSVSRRIPTCSTPSPARRARRRRRRARAAAAASCPYFDSGSSVDEAFQAAILAPEPQGGRHPASGQVGLRLARHPGHVPPDRRRAPQGAQDGRRRREGLRDPGPRQFRGVIVGRSAATSAGSPRASSMTS